jgi:pimeloyl-ACP methyl ester carboxylesterase
MTLEPLDRTIDIGGLALHYRETGAGSGLPVVALHGHPGTASTWDEVAVGVCGAGDCRFLAVSQRGYGRSGRMGPYSFETFADDVLAFADRLGLGRFVLIGHSMGGTVASLVAARASSRLLGLVLEDSVTPRDGVRLPVPERPAAPELVQELPYDWELVPAIFGEIAEPDPGWWSSLARISVPTLVIAGGSTSHVPQAVLVDVAAIMPRAKLVTLEGAGHSVHRDASERFLGEVMSFLGELGVEGPRAD